MKLTDLRQKRIELLKADASRDEHGWFELSLTYDEMRDLHHDPAFKDVEFAQMDGCVAYGIRLVQK